MRRILFYYSVSLMMLFITLPRQAYAALTPTPAINPTSIPSDLGNIPTKRELFVAQYYKYGLGMIGGLALLYIIFGSYIILTSKGNPEQLNNGKSYIGYAIVGLLLAIFGYLFVGVITGDILQIPGFSSN